MSGLEKFQPSEAWRSKLKNLLLMQRNIPQSPVQLSERFSLDLTDDFQVLLEEKAIPRSSATTDHTVQKDTKMFQDGNYENRPSKNLQAPTKKPTTQNDSTMTYCDDTICDELQTNQMQRISDESFEAMEKMCDKTASDPNSTLFQYIHGDNKEEIVSDAKKRSADGNKWKTPSKKDLEEIGKEADDLQRLLHQLCVHEQEQLENVTPVKGVDVTQLEDIEAPSKLWETTIVANAMFPTSPVKMVGLLRPSTIIEEFGEETNNLSDLSSQMSFQSALKSADATGSHYDTAHDSTGASVAVPAYVKSKINYNFDVQPEKVKKVYKSEISIDLDSSIDLINFDKTMAPNDNTSERKSTENPDILKDSLFDESNSVIEIISDDDSDIDENGTKTEKGGEPIKADSDMNTFSTNEALDCTTSFFDEEDKENNLEFSKSGDNSLHFNDTMEEVDYMMKKGMQYINENAQYNLKTKENTFTISPDKSACVQPLLQPMKVVTGVKEKPFISSPRRTPKFCPSKQKSATKHYGMDIKPLPKLDLFKKPAATPNRLKESNHKQFPHIISPVGIYMKKTATAPLLTNFKKRADVHNATVFRELAQDSQLYKPKFDTAKRHVNSPTTSLPKKAYISSEFKHVTDERTPIIIPGGKTIQKYIEGAILPTVVRHEGKAHLPTTSSAVVKDAIKQRKDPSLANLSVMSGDISVYTMKDAQQF